LLRVKGGILISHIGGRSTDKNDSPEAFKSSHAYLVWIQLYDMTSVAPTVCRALGVRPPASAAGSPLSMVESMGGTERLAVVVIDAFGVSTWRKAKDRTPTFNRLRELHGAVISSVMPSRTPVNFATMLTGADPAAHGITDREQPLRLETVFDVVRETGGVSATAARAKSSNGILVSPHADMPGVAASNLDSEVTEIALGMLYEGVSLLWVQLLDVDDAGHAHGPYSPESMGAARRADENLRQILDAARSEGYSVMALADHGQHTSPEDAHRGVHGTDAPEDLEVPFLWASDSELKSVLG